MTGPEHYRKAEEALSILDVERDVEDWNAAIRNGDLALAISAAQAHATLALAAATALGLGTEGLPATDWDVWYRAVSEGPGEKRRRQEAEAAELAEFAKEPQS